MTEHKTCINCPYNEYPLCKGTIMYNEGYMNIENLKQNFKCGQKDVPLTDFSIIKKSELELKVELLELKVKELEVSKLS